LSSIAAELSIEQVFGGLSLLDEVFWKQILHKSHTKAEACGNAMKVSMDGRGRAKDNIWIERF
jgi:hypothetical protein